MLRRLRHEARSAASVIRCGAVLATLALSACASIDIKNPAEAASATPDPVPAIHVGQTDRAAVRGLLGEPLFASDSLRFDLFRTASTQSSVPIVLAPVPVPLGRMKDEWLRYTLVTYDDAGRVVARASGIFDRPSEFRRLAPIDSEHAALHLRAGVLLFFVDPERDRRENLLVAPADPNAVVASLGRPSTCTVVIGCGAGGCPDRLSADGAPPGPLPLRIVELYWLSSAVRESWLSGTAAAGGERSPWLETLAVLEFPPGRHSLRFSSEHLGGEHEAVLECAAGRVSYWVLSATDNGRFANRALEDWRIENRETMPEAFARRPLVILYGGRWFLEAAAR